MRGLYAARHHLATSPPALILCGAARADSLKERGDSFTVSLYCLPEIWRMRQTFAHTVASAQQNYNESGQTRSVNPWISLGAGYHPTANRTGANELLPGTECERNHRTLTHASFSC